MMLRIVKGVSFVLGAAILATLVLIGYGLYTRDSKAPDANPQPLNAQTPVAVPAPVGDFSDIPLDQPAGSAIAAVTPHGDRLYVTVTGGGRADRVVVVDLTRGRSLGAVTLDAGGPPRPAR